MENTKDFRWFEEEAVKAVMTNGLSFSDEYYKEIDRQVTEEMHRILEWEEIMMKYYILNKNNKQ